MLFAMDALVISIFARVATLRARGEADLYKLM